MTNGPKTIESILSLIPDERILKRVHPSDIILFEPIGFIAPIILFIAALEYLTSQPIFSLLLIVGGIVSFIFYYSVYKSTEYIVTDHRIISHIKFLNRVRSIPISATQDIFMKANFIKVNGARTVVIQDSKGHEFQLRAIKEWKDVVEMIYKVKYGEDVIINFQ